MKRLMLLLKSVLEDSGTLCDVSTIRDLKTVSDRFEHEGLSFLAIALPAFCDDFFKAVSTGVVSDDLFAGFTRVGGLPRFLGGFLRLVFDSDSGAILDSPSVDAIASVRQVCSLFGKLERVCNPSREAKAIRQYVEVEVEVSDGDAVRSSEALFEFRSAFARLFGNACQNIENSLSLAHPVPKHGPGATADKRRGNAKYRQDTWPERLEEWFPASEFLIPSQRYRDSLSSLTYLDPGAEIPARLVSVPKTLKNPRLIAIEPVAMQYTQQSLLEMIVDELESADNPLSHIVGFDDQAPNRDLAQIGSLTGSIATLDLSEASDRVSNQLVVAAFRRFPFLSGSLQACRTIKVDVPGHGVLSLSKFASMGSATCFPIEAMVFATIVLIGIERQESTRFSGRSLVRALRSVRVYGDDIIVPVEYTYSVIGALESFGLKVNPNKSFWTGKFRESCGGDFYSGEDITPVRMRTDLPDGRADAREIISTVSLRNQMYFHGYWKTARYLDELLGRLIPYPVVMPSSPVLGRHSYLGYQTDKLHRDYQSPLVRGMMVRSVIPRNSLDGIPALLKFFLKRGDNPSYDERHLERSGRPLVVSIKPRMGSPF